MTGTVTDAIAVRGRVAARLGVHGMILCIESDGRPIDPAVGDVVLIQRPNGWMVERQVIQTREYEEPAGFFVGELEAEDVPVGSTVRWGRDAILAVAGASGSESTTSRL